MARIMTTREIAEYLNLNQVTVCKYAAEGRIPAIRIGKVWRFDRDAVDAWVGSDKTHRKDGRGGAGKANTPVKPGK